jgi:hypothetical protein
MKALYREYGQRVQFLDVFVRQAHPGEARGPYRTYEEKMEGARRYQREEAIPWPVLVDDLEGTVHHTYGGLADPTYLIDAEGRVAFYNMWSHAPTLRQALDELLARGGVGVPVAGGINRTPHLFASFVNGWRAVLDLELSTPGSGTLTFLGNVARPALGPLALGTRPTPVRTQVAVWAGVAGAVVFVLALWSRRRR